MSPLSRLAITPAHTVAQYFLFLLFPIFTQMAIRRVLDIYTSNSTTVILLPSDFCARVLLYFANGYPREECGKLWFLMKTVRVIMIF